MSKTIINLAISILILAGIVIFVYFKPNYGGSETFCKIPMGIIYAILYCSILIAPFIGILLALFAVMRNNNKLWRNIIFIFFMLSNSLMSAIFVIQFRNIKDDVSTIFGVIFLVASISQLIAFFYKNLQEQKQLNNTNE